MMFRNADQKNTSTLMRLIKIKPFESTVQACKNTSPMWAWNPQRSQM